MRVKRFFLRVLLVAVSIKVQGQIPDSDSLANSEAGRQYEIFYAEMFPAFPGGAPAAKKYFSEQITYPFWARLFNFQDTITVSFIAMKGGSYADITVIRGKNRVLINSVLRAVNRMPKFTAAESAGLSPRALYHLTVSFRSRCYFTHSVDIRYTLFAVKSFYYDKAWTPWTEGDRTYRVTH